MTKDLEETLEELEPECYAVVARLLAGAEVEPAPHAPDEILPPIKRAKCRVPLLAAASVLVLLGLGSIILHDAKRPVGTDARGAAREYRLADAHTGVAIAEMIRTQNADGSWKNDFLTRRNAAALAQCHGMEARIAYKKAMRNLRMRGLL